MGILHQITKRKMKLST